MKKTRLSLFYLAGYLIPTGLSLFFAPQWTLKALFASGEYTDVFPQFAGSLMVALGIIVLAVIRYGNPVFYRTTLIVRVWIWLSVLGIYLRSGERLLVVVLGVVGFGMLLTGSLYLSERNRLKSASGS
ncbi:MAG: hypothetical protein ABL995_00260 [Bryobacteraceae bacterium]